MHFKICRSQQLYNLKQDKILCSANLRKFYKHLDAIIISLFCIYYKMFCILHTKISVALYSK